MNILVTIFNEILYRPLLNLLFLFYQYLPGKDLGIAVIVLTILIKFIFYPLGTIALKSQKTLSDLQPKIKEIQERYKNDKEKQTKAMMEMYKEKKINPFSGCLPLLIQFPILIALYQVFLKGLKPEAMAQLYNFVPQPGEIDQNFLGLINLSQPNTILAFLAGISQFIQLKTAPQTKKLKGKQFDVSQMMTNQMTYLFPLFAFFICLKLPSAIALYWVVMTIFTIFQQYFIVKRYPT
jgi:YidC/Oxa1 family membrane protein insertase